jgi:hypothetical protein
MKGKKYNRKLFSAFIPFIPFIPVATAFMANRAYMTCAPLRTFPAVFFLVQTRETKARLVSLRLGGEINPSRGVLCTISAATKIFWT